MTKPDKNEPRVRKSLAHFNELTPAEAERLALLLEELGETQQAIGKILRHGYHSVNPCAPGPNNQEALEAELGHVQAAVKMMVDRFDLSPEAIDASCSLKLQTVVQWTHHQSHIPPPPEDER